MIVSAFLIILLAFNILIARYTSRIAGEHIVKAGFRFFLYTAVMKRDWQFTRNESGDGLPTACVVLAESETGNRAWPAWLNAEEKLMTQYLELYYQQNRF